MYKDHLDVVVKQVLTYNVSLPTITYFLLSKRVESMGK